MRKKAILLGFVLLITTVSAQIFPFTEDYEDDTPGANPTGDYTYFESNSGPAVTTSGHTGNGLNIPSGSFITHDLSGGTSGFDPCSGSETFEHWFRPTYGGAVSQEALIVFHSESPTGSFIRAMDDDGMFGLQLVPDSGTSLRIQVALFGPSGNTADTLITSTPFGQWYKIIYSDMVCTGTPEITATLYDSSETQIAQRRETCPSCGNFIGTLDKFSVGQARNGVTQHPAFRIDTLGGGTPLPPSAPEGLNGIVSYSQQQSGVTDALVDLSWQMSPDDPDQENGTFDYRVYEDNVLVATDTTETDGDGFREIQLSYSQVSPIGTKTYHVTAVDTTSSLESADSCTITLDLDTQSSQSTCGGGGSPGNLNTAPPSQGTSLFAEDGPLYGGNKTNLADTLQVSENALDALYGFIWIMILGGAGWLVVGQNVFGAVGGLVAGLAFNIAFGLWPIWLVIFILFLCATVVVLIRRQS